MKTITLLFLLFPATLYSQKTSFEGIIWFSSKYEISDSSFSENQLKEQFGDRYVCYIRDGNYRQEYLNSKGIEYVQYDSGTNFYYYKLRNTDTLYVINCGHYSDKIEIEDTDSIINIAGYDCKIINTRMIKPNVTVTYYFANEIYLDPTYYKKHKLGAYNKVMKGFHAVYLKQETEYGPYKTTITADSLRIDKLDKKIFELPELPMRRN